MSNAELTCETCQVLLLDYVEGRLPAVQRAAMQLHLSHCLPCHRRQEEMSLTLQAYQAPERPSAATRMAIYEEARQQTRVSGLPPWQRPLIRYALAASLLVAVALLLRPIWRSSTSISELPTESAISLPAPTVSSLKIEYSHSIHDVSTLKQVGWVVEGNKIQWQGDTTDRGSLEPVYEIGAGDLDDLIRVARHLNVIPIPILTPEPRSCPREDNFETMTIEFEGRKLKMRSCESESGDAAQREFFENFKKWTAARTSGHYVP